MKTRKFWSFLLSFAMVLGIITIPTYAQDTAVNTINAYLTISKYGEIVNDKDNNAVATAKVELTGKDEYTLDDLFVAAHDLYYDGGATSGYQSGETTWGLSVQKFWGDTSGNFGYQINGGSVNVTGLSNTVNNGDYVDAYIMTPNWESYSNFDKYSAEIYVNQELDFTLNYVSGYDENYAPIVSVCPDATITVDGAETQTKTDSDGKATISFDNVGKYIVSASKTQTINEEETTLITAPVCVVTVKSLPDTKITVPSDAQLFVGEKVKHYVPFTEKISVIATDNEDGTTSYYYDLSNRKTYNYRVSGDDYVTYGGIFTKNANFSLNITAEQLSPDGKTKNTIDRNTASNNGYNVADIYLNINPQGYLKMSKDDTYQIVNLRNWEAVDTVSNNYFIEPDYHYEVTDENGNATDIVEIDDDGLITAKESGTAIVLVTYDAMTVDSGTPLSGFYGAIWPENTGVFVVTVDGEESGIEPNITINEGENTTALKLSGDKLDSEHDCIYYIGDTGEFTFTPITEGVLVSVANPTVDTKTTYSGFSDVSANLDGSFTVPLKTGRNIVKIEKDGKAEYQIITAKQVSVTINNGDAVHPGDKLSIKFDKLYHPANKLAGVYNMKAAPIYENVSAYTDKLIGSTQSQYTFANECQTIANEIKFEMKSNGWFSNEVVTKLGDLTVPEDYQYDTFTLKGGKLRVKGFGDPYGNHRGITYEIGKDPNFAAEERLAYLGKLPDIEIPIVATDAELSSITLDTNNVQTTYYEGDKFDTTNLAVTANFEDGKTQIVSNYTVTPEILTKDTESVIINYNGKTAEIPVTVNELKVTSIEIAKAPNKTEYTEGETLNPTGMVVNAIYNSGKKAQTKSYSYSPNRELETTDTEMTVTYTGDDAAENVNSVSQPITVTEKSSGGSTGTSNKITVYFTLLGDDKHGTPTGDSDTHTKASNNLKTWISKTAISVDKGSYVIDVVEKALGIAGIPFDNGGNYITEINGLAEFSNGEYSGWMYMINGNYSNLGVEEQTVKSGDKIIFHYTDDYNQENYSENQNTSSGGSSVSTYTVKFDTNGANTIKAQTVERNDVATEPTEPVKDGYTFDGWYTDKNFTKKYDFDKKVTGNITLYAKWTKSVEREPEPDNTENSETTITFSDVSPDSWYNDAVTYSIKNNLFNGVSETEFAPNENMTRAMLVTVLYRLENPKTTNATHSFSDVTDDEWYSDAVLWATENDIVNGVSETEFAPNDSITREQMATVIYRYAKMKGYNTENNTELSDFADATQISDWAVDAIKWANSADIINGVDKSTLSPKATATRAQVATILMRFCEMNVR